LKYGDLLSKDARISTELEIDSFLSQMIGTFDYLLFSIVDKFQLYDIPRDKIEIEIVLSVLSAELSQRVELATSNLRNWYWMVKHLRNYSLYG
jgi:hypothetical protein